MAVLVILPIETGMGWRYRESDHRRADERERRGANGAAYENGTEPQ